MFDSLTDLPPRSGCNYDPQSPPPFLPIDVISIIKYNMEKRYDFSNTKSSPSEKKMRKQISIRIDIDTIEYFKMKAKETGIAYQNLINLYLKDCAEHSRDINIVWK